MFRRSYYLMCIILLSNLLQMKRVDWIDDRIEKYRLLPSEDAQLHPFLLTFHQKLAQKGCR